MTNNLKNTYTEIAENLKSVYTAPRSMLQNVIAKKKGRNMHWICNLTLLLLPFIFKQNLVYLHRFLIELLFYFLSNLLSTDPLLFQLSVPFTSIIFVLLGCVPLCTSTLIHTNSYICMYIYTYRLFSHTFTADWCFVVHRCYCYCRCKRNESYKHLENPFFICWQWEVTVLLG